MSDCEISLPYLWEPADRNISRDQGLFIFLAKHRLWEGDGLCVQSLCWRDSRKPPENLLFSSLSFLLSLSLCLLLCSFTHSFFASSLIICLDVNSWSRDITFKTADDFKFCSQPRRCMPTASALLPIQVRLQEVLQKDALVAGIIWAISQAALLLFLLGNVALAGKKCPPQFIYILKVSHVNNWKVWIKDLHLV